MSKFGAFLSLVAGLAVLVGYFMPEFGGKYYLVPVGGVLAVLAAIVAFKSNRIY